MVQWLHKEGSCSSLNREITKKRHDSWQDRKVRLRAAYQLPEATQLKRGNKHKSDKMKQKNRNANKQEAKEGTRCSDTICKLSVKLNDSSLFASELSPCFRELI